MKDLDKYRDQLSHRSEKRMEGDPISDFLDRSQKVKVDDSQKASSWDNIISQIESEETPKTRSLWPVYSIAAAITLLIASIFVFRGNQSGAVEILALTGETAEHTLPDGSIVYLNALSSIQYNTEWDRKILLDGEAFFKVTEGEKFTVSTAQGSVQVLGTSFNVFSRGSDFEVACKTGKVAVKAYSGSDEIELEPGEFVALDKAMLVQGTKIASEIGNWTSGEFYFSEKPVIEVFAEVERQYNTRIEVKEGDTLKFSGYFFKESSLQETMELICTPNGLTFEQENDIYIIRIRK